MPVRRLGSEDFDLAVEAVRKVKEPTPHPTFGSEYLKKFLSRPENVLIVAEQGGVVTGFLLAYLLDRVDRDQRMICLYEIEVLETYHQRGIGRALIDTLKLLGKQENAMEIWVITNRSNVAAVRLYSSTGAAAEASGDEVVFVYEPESWSGTTRQ
jgi:ribosomal protein S18 acetylase RimI-like enzyme